MMEPKAPEIIIPLANFVQHLTPTPTLSLHLTLHLTLPRNVTLSLNRFEYLELADGERNIVSENPRLNEVRIGKWMRAAQKGLKMSCDHTFGHPGSFLENHGFDPFLSQPLTRIGPL